MENTNENTNENKIEIVFRDRISAVNFSLGLSHMKNVLISNKNIYVVHSNDIKKIILKRYTQDSIFYWNDIASLYGKVDKIVGYYKSKLF